MNAWEYPGSCSFQSPVQVQKMILRWVWCPEADPEMPQGQGWNYQTQSQLELPKLERMILAAIRQLPEAETIFLEPKSTSKV